MCAQLCCWVMPHVVSMNAAFKVVCGWEALRASNYHSSSPLLFGRSAHMLCFFGAIARMASTRFVHPERDELRSCISQMKLRFG